MSRYRHRRTDVPTKPFTNPLEPGEIAVNTANRQIAIGDAQSGVAGVPLPAIAVRFFDTRAQYAQNDFVTNNGMVLRAKATILPGPFDISKWDQTGGGTDPQYVLKAGDTMTGPLVMPPGTVAANSIHFGTAGTGFSGAGAQLTFSVSGTQRVQIGTTDVTFAPRISASAGSSGAAAIHFGTSNTGLYGSGTAVSVTVGGGNKLTLTTSSVTATVPIVLPADPTTALQCVTKQYVDARPSGVLVSSTPPAGAADGSFWFDNEIGLTFIRYNDGNSTQWVAAFPQPDISQFVNRAGDTMTGALSLPAAAPTLAAHATNKAYVDAQQQIPPGSVMLFYQAAAPTGWTQVATHNNKALRVVSGTGGGAAGTNPFTTVFAQTVVGSTTLDTNTLPAHNHTFSSSICNGASSATGGGAAFAGTGTTTMSAAGSSAAHNHTITMNIQYIDVIIASRD